MGFGSTPKAPPTDWQMRDLQKQQLQASIDAAQASTKLPGLKSFQAPKIAPPPQQSAADVAAAQRLARQNMASRKGLAWTQAPGQTLGGAGNL